MADILKFFIREQGNDEQETLATRRTLQAILILVIAGLAGILFFDGIIARQVRTLYSFAPLELALIFCLWMLRRGILYPAQLIIPLGTLIARDYLTTVGVGIHDVSMIAYGAIIILAYYTLTRRGAFVFSWLVILSVAFIGIGEVNHILVNDYSKTTTFNDVIIVAIILLAMSGMMYIIIGQLNEAIVRSRASELKQIEANAELQGLKIALEKRVEERTIELQSASMLNTHRASQFEAIVQVTNAINSIRNTSELLPKIASVVSEHFGFYHVGIFINDENNLYTFLTASNSEGGQRMLSHGYNLKIGEQGIVGYVAATGEARIANKVGEDLVFFNNPNLPETKAELALPLRTADKIMGVLDVQSTQEGIFTEDDIRVLSILADQISLAIENTRLFETTRRSLEDAEALYRQYLRQAWSRLPREQQLAGYRYNQRATMPLESPVVVDVQNAEGVIQDANAGTRINVPIKLRGETFGNLIVYIPRDRQWNQDQLDLIEAVAERVALSAENARLFDETSRRAERERMVTEITSKIRSTNDPEAMIRTALDELRNALGATQVQLIPQAISASESNQSNIISSTPQDPAQKTQRANGARK
jgi:GAF domain-containing protein